MNPAAIYAFIDGAFDALVLGNEFFCQYMWQMSLVEKVDNEMLRRMHRAAAQYNSVTYGEVGR